MLASICVRVFSLSVTDSVMAFKAKLIITVTALAAMSAGFWLSTLQQQADEKSAQTAKEKALAQARNNFSPIQGTILSPARKVAVPALIQDNGQSFTLDDLSGQWHLLFFGYTHCPDICPTTMGVAAQAKKLAAANNKPFPQVVFVSVDPERDKVGMLSEYVKYFDKDFIAVTGEKDLIKALTLQMSVVYMKMPARDESQEDEASKKGYTMDHSAALLLLNPEGKLVAFLNPPHDPKTIIKDFQTVANLEN